MSLLFVGYNEQKETFVSVNIMRKAAKLLFAEVIEPLAKVVKDKDFLDKADADLMMENVNFSNLNQDEFKKAYGLVEKSASDDTLQPYAQEILQKMQADPRYTA